MSELKVNKISPRSGTDVTLGDSGDTFTLPTGVTLDTSNSTVTLPDGSVTNAKIADSTIQLAKLSATGTKDATTFLRGDNTFAEAGGGKLLQVVQTTSTSSYSSTSTTLVDTGYSATITPSATTSKILAIATFPVYHTGTHQSHYTFDRNSTQLHSGSSGMITVYSIDDHIFPTTLNFLDTPNSTSALTYTVFAKINSGTLQLGGQGAEVVIQLMEIAG